MTVQTTVAKHHIKDIALADEGKRRTDLIRLGRWNIAPQRAVELPNIPQSSRKTSSVRTARPDHTCQSRCSSSADHQLNAISATSSQ